MLLVNGGSFIYMILYAPRLSFFFFSLGVTWLISNYFKWKSEVAKIGKESTSSDGSEVLWFAKASFY